MLRKRNYRLTIISISSFPKPKPGKSEPSKPDYPVSSDSMDLQVQDFYTVFYTAQRATDAYQKECAKWDEAYGEQATPKAKTQLIKAFYGFIIKITNFLTAN